MNLKVTNTKYEIKGLTKFKKQLKKSIKQGKDINELKTVLRILAEGKPLDPKYKDHSLTNTNVFRGCRECHIEANWLLIYKYNNKELILLLTELGSHSELFK